MATNIVKRLTGGAVGAGLVLVVLPSLALVLGVQFNHLNKNATVVLPLLAIFGIMILFGAMALTSALFARLDLANRNEALGLPAGSVRAAIALALIVLFAIIAILLFQSLSEPYRIAGLNAAEKEAIVKNTSNRVLAVKERTPCPSTSAAPAAGAASASAADACFDVHLVQPPGQEAADIAKQLLILIGTLMTSVTSYYFAARTAEPARDPLPADGPGAPDVAPITPSPAPTPTDSVAPSHEHGVTGESEAADGCDVAITDITTDEELPASKGGVA